MYGTDENEDSLDSLIHNEDSLPSTAISSRRTSICGEAAEVIVVDQNLSRCCSRASNPPDIAEGCDTDPAGHQPICPLYTQTCAKTGSSYEVKTSDPSNSGSCLDKMEHTITTKTGSGSSKVECQGVEEEVSRPVSASGLCRRLQLIEVVGSSKEEDPEPELSLLTSDKGEDQRDGSVDQQVVDSQEFI